MRGGFLDELDGSGTRIFFSEDKALPKAWVNAWGNSSANLDVDSSTILFFFLFEKEIGLIIDRDARIGALISCFSFLACSFVLVPFVGGLYGGRYGGKGEVSHDSSEEESDEMMIVSWSELMLIFLGENLWL